MNWGKFAAAATAVLLLSGCTSQPGVQPTPTPSSNLLVLDQTGDPDADKLIAIIRASCKLGKRLGMAINVPEEIETLYSFPVAPEDNELDLYLNTLTLKGGKYGIGGWPELDPLCSEAVYVDGVVARGSAPNEDGIVFDYDLKKVDDNTYDWAVHRGSPDKTFHRISFDGDRVTSIEWGNDFTFLITYGPLGKELMDMRQRQLVAQGLQYLQVGNNVWGMKVPEAKAYLKKRGLTLLVGMEDDMDYYPSGPPFNKSDPKRMIVNVIGGEIVGVWTL